MIGFGQNCCFCCWLLGGTVKEIKNWVEFFVGHDLGFWGDLFAGRFLFFLGGRSKKT